MASGVISRFEPDPQVQLSYFYSEFSAIHDNYLRRVEFTVQEILPRAVLGADGFYGPGGRLMPQFEVHMTLLSEFSADLRRLNARAKQLRLILEAQRKD